MLVLMMLAAAWTLVPAALHPVAALAALERHLARFDPPPPPIGVPGDERRLYCLEEQLAASMETRQVCRSRRDWAALGFAPIAPGPPPAP
jgi:hypothetical protein